MDRMHRSYLRCGLELLSEIWVLVVQRIIEAQVFFKPLAFIVCACDSDDASTPHLTDLADDRAGGTSSSRDYHQLTGLRIADVFEPEVCCQAGTAYIC